MGYYFLESDVATALNALVEQAEVTRSELSRRTGISQGHLSRMLGRGEALSWKNVTNVLGSIERDYADLMRALGLPMGRRRPSPSAPVDAVERDGTVMAMLHNQAQLIASLRRDVDRLRDELAELGSAAD